MDFDFQTILYIIAIIIYFLYSFSKAKKKEAAKRKTNNEKRISSSTNNKQTPLPKPKTPFSFETILKEFEKNINPEYEDKTSPEPVKQIPYSIETKKVPQKQEKKWERIREDKGESVRKGELREPIPTKTYSIENQPKKSISVPSTPASKQKPGKKSSLYSYFHSTSKLREAVILSEILNRKEEL